MAARYWVGGTAAWDGTAGTKWAATSGGAGGASVPTTADDVFLDANSGVVTVTISTGNTGAKSLTCTGFTGTLTGASASVILEVAGNITLSSGMTSGAVHDITITATSTIISAGKTLCNDLRINAPGATVSLGDALATNSAGDVIVIAGTFTTTASNYSVTTGVFNMSGTTTRSVLLNGSTITLNAQFLATTTTGLTFTPGTSTIALSGGTNMTFDGGGLTYYNASFAYSGGSAGTFNIDGANTYNQLTITPSGSAGVVNKVVFSSTQTIGTFVCAGATAVSRLFLYSDVLGTQRTLNVTTWTTISDVDFRDIAMGASISGTRLSDCGGNSNITFPASKTVYWNLAGTRAAQSSTGWAATSGGAPAVNNLPLAQDIAIIDDAGAAETLSFGGSCNFGEINFSSRTLAVTLNFGGFNLHKDLRLSSSVAIGGSTGTLSVLGRSTTQTITSAGRVLNSTLDIFAIGGTVRLLDAFATARDSGTAVRINNGTFDTNGYNVTLSGATASLFLSGTATKALAIGASLIDVQGSGGFSVGSAVGTTISGTGTIRLSSASAKSITTAGASFSGIAIDQGGAGALTISGTATTFGDLTNSYKSVGATTITLATNATFENFSASGEAGRILTFNSSSASTTRTITKTSGTVSVDYISIQRSAATGGATWTAGVNSINAGNNTGWIFLGELSGSNFMLMFL